MVDIKNIPYGMAVEISRVVQRWLDSLKVGIETVEAQGVAELFKTSQDLSELKDYLQREIETNFHDIDLLELKDYLLRALASGNDPLDFSITEAFLKRLFESETIEVEAPDLAMSMLYAIADVQEASNDDLLHHIAEMGQQDFEICGYDDTVVSLLNVKMPTSNAPTDRLYNHGISSGIIYPVLGFAVDNYIYFDIQTSHSMKLSSVLENHIHYTTPTSGTGYNFSLRLDVISAPIDGAWAVPSGSPFTVDIAMTSDLSNTHKVDPVANIPGVNTTVSTLYKCRLKRKAATTNEYPGEVYIQFNDCHYQKDSIGSLTQNHK